MPLPRPLLAIFLAALLGHAAMGAPNFASPVNVSSTTGGAIGTSAGDLNKDGRVEFISAASKSSNDPHLRIYQWNVATSMFNIYNVFNPSSGQDRFGGDLEIADMNNDTWPDILVPESNNANGSGSVYWFENPDGNLSGTWTKHVITTWSGSGADSVAHLSEIDAGDIDGNGWVDVVVRDVSHGFSVMLQNDTGTGWKTRRDIAANPREGLELWNPDGDSDLDILLCGAWFETPDDPATGTYTLHLIKNAEAWYPSGNSSNEQRDYACQVTLGDFNNDTRMDFAITNSEELANAASTDSKPKGVRVFLAPVDPINDNWTEIVLHSQHFSWHSCEVDDVDGDGDLDVITGISQVGLDSTSAQIHAFLNNGDGISFTDITFDTGHYIYQASLGDVDGDGDPDLFAPNDWSSGNIRFFKNELDLAVTLPNAPTDLSALAASSSRIDLSWTDNADNETAYIVQRKTSGSGAYSNVASLGGNVVSYSDTGLSPETNYTYQIIARNNIGDTTSNTASATTESAPPIEDGLVAHWRLDEESGTIASDQTSLHDGTLIGNPVWTPDGGEMAGALTYDGDDRVQVDSFDISGTALTITAWVRPTSYTGYAAEARYVSKATGTNGPDHYWMLGNYLDGTAVRFRLNTSSGGTATLVSNQNALPLNTWTHVAATYDGTTMRLFANGVEVASQSKTGNITAAPGVAIGIGNQPIGAGDRGLIGQLDDVRIYNLTLDATDLAALIDLKNNEPPMATITAPLDYAQYSVIENINLSGNGTDSEDGALTGSQLSWSSSLDGALGSGDTLTTNLSVGTHQIRLRAKDSLGFSGQAIIAIEILTDADSDGIPDSFESAHGLPVNDAANATLDTDGDGTTDYEEWLANTGPTNGASRFNITDMAPANVGEFTLTWNSAANRHYTISSSPDLINYTPVLSVAADPPTQSVTIPIALTGPIFLRMTASR